MKLFILAILAVAVSSITSAQTYTSITHPFPNLGYSSSDWGDYDNDGDLDLALAGSTSGTGYVCEIFRNDSGSFFGIDAGMIPVRSGSVEWGDYDVDGDLDLLICGNANSQYISRIYRNDALSFVELNFGGPDFFAGSAQWFDLDSDGDLDISLLGSTLDEFVTTIFRNDGNDHFAERNMGLPACDRGSLDWGDYDEDGDPDLLMTGRQHSDFKPRTRVFRNDGDTLIALPLTFLHIWDGQALWLDYDQDGDLDIIAAGSDSTSGFPFTDIYRNDNGLFSDINASIEGCGEGASIDIGDVDNDGDFDVVQLGVFGPGSDVYIFDGDSTFARLMLGTLISCCGTVRFADYDNDGDLDFIDSGLSTKTKFYQNSGVVANTPPTAPTSLTSLVDADSVLLTWGSATDNETSSSGLSYNVRIGSSPGEADIVSPMSDPVTGFRCVVSLGNAYMRLNFKMKNLSPGIYYWSVQSIDNGWKGSPFAPELTFVIGDIEYLCGDADGNDIITISDAVFLINYIFSGGPGPVPLIAADADCSDSITISDAVYLINFIFSSGPAPCASCL